MTLGFTETFPPFDLSKFAKKTSKICVVAIIGKGRYSAFTSKATLLNPTIGKNVFKGLEDVSSEDEMEYYYDACKQVVYVHYSSLLDTQRLANLCLKMDSDVAQQDFHTIWELEEFHHAKTWLLLFCISHVIVLVHPGSSFDPSYIRIFRILDTVRIQLQGLMSEQLQGFPISKDWCVNGRPCSPRVLFVFETTLLDVTTDENDLKVRPQVIFIGSSKFQQISPKEGRSIQWPKRCESGNKDEDNSPYNRNPPLKRLQHATEDQIYRLLRKSRVITNISNNSLFAVPANQEFVYIHNRKADINDPVLYFLLQLRNSHTVNKDGEPTKGGKSYQTNRRTNQGSPGRNDGTMRSTLANKSLSTSDCSFHDFLWPHIQLAFTKGFDDNVGKRQIPALFEMTTVYTWFSLAAKLYQFFFHDLDKKSSVFNKMRFKLDVDIRFSEKHIQYRCITDFPATDGSEPLLIQATLQANEAIARQIERVATGHNRSRCNKVLPVAENAYQDGLPTHYTFSYHISKFNQAKRVFAQYARGPAYDKYLRQLEESCEKWWKNGRQLCEEVSLTGQHCVNPLHQLPDSLETEENQHLPVMPHSSQVKTKAACNCGRKQAEKDDPFSHEAANFEFYENLEKICCSSLQHVEIPVFKPDTDSFVASPLVKSNGFHLRDGSKGDLAPGIGNLSLALSLGQSGGSDLFNSATLNHDSLAEAGNSHQQEIRLTQPEVERVFDRQHSTTEYLPGMVNTDSPSGLLPKFSSWSCCMIGKTSSYNHTQGLELPGFFHGSNFLLPWDITVRMERDKWPGLGEANKKGKPKRVPKGQLFHTVSLSAHQDVREQGEVLVRVYIGIEYECPRAHRFFCSGPDKIIKVSSSSSVKDTAHKLLTCDMPLYSACPCRNPKGHVAQLMRVYVATPEGPVCVTLKPMVQPGPPPHCPLFHPTMDDYFRLPPGGIWVLRFPHIYVGNGQVYSKPTDLSQPTMCRLMKGIFGYQHVDT